MGPHDLRYTNPPAVGFCGYEPPATFLRFVLTAALIP